MEGIDNEASRENKPEAKDKPRKYVHSGMVRNQKAIVDQAAITMFRSIRDTSFFHIYPFKPLPEPPRCVAALAYADKLGPFIAQPKNLLYDKEKSRPVIQQTGVLHFTGNTLED